MAVQDASADSDDFRRLDDHRADGRMAWVQGSSEERRRCCRHAQRLSLTISVFNRGAHFQAQMVNYSQDGVCAQTGQSILPGTSLHVRIDPSQAAALEGAVFPALRTTALGEVKWSRSLGGDPLRRYIVGIRYYSYY